MTDRNYPNDHEVFRVSPENVRFAEVGTVDHSYDEEDNKKCFDDHRPLQNIKKNIFDIMSRS